MKTKKKLHVALPDRKKKKKRSKIKYNKKTVETSEEEKEEKIREVRRREEMRGKERREGKERTRLTRISTIEQISFLPPARNFENDSKVNESITRPQFPLVNIKHPSTDQLLKIVFPLFQILM